MNFFRTISWAWMLAVSVVPLGARAFKVYIFADMEGCTGIERATQLRAEEGQPSEGVIAMEDDINACVAACIEAGATEVVVRDGHSSGTNVRPARIDPRAQLIQGPSRSARFPNLKGAEAIILLGYHAKSLTTNAVLAHSYSSQSIQRMFLNGREIGEIGIDAAIAGEHGVPVVLVIGDDQACEEAREWIPGVVTCATKVGTGPQRAQLLPPTIARQRIREATIRALQQRHWIAPLRISYPVTLTYERLPPGSRRTYDPEFVPVKEPRRDDRVGECLEELLLRPAR